MAASIIQIALDHEGPLPALAEHQPVEFVRETPAGAWAELLLDGVAAEPFLRPGQAAWRWRWNPGAAVGLHRVALTLSQSGETSHTEWALRVEPRKIDQEHYAALLDDLERAAHALAYQLGGAAAEGAQLGRDPVERGRLEEYYALFEGRLDGFARAVRRIAARPREQLRADVERIPLGRAAGLDGQALARIAQGALDDAPPDVAAELQEALRPGGGLLPRDIATARPAPTFDTYEHRLLKQLLAALARRARLIGELAERELRRMGSNERDGGFSSGRLGRVREIAQGCADALGTLRELRALPFLAEVGPLPSFRGPTPLLQREASYREVYRMWQALRQHGALLFDSPLFAIPIADLPALYERWCAVMLAEAMLRLGGALREQRLVATRPADDDNELLLTVDLVENAPLLVIERGGATLVLRYQPRYRPAGSRAGPRLGSLDKHTRVPDLAVELHRPGAPPQVLVFDAKYRLDADGRGVPQDALADAYAYLGAIGVAGCRATLGALLLYPGAATERFPSGVGAVALLPGENELVRLLGELLEENQG